MGYSARRRFAGFATRAASCALLGIAAVAVGSAQPISVSGPVEGFVFDAPTGSLRSLVGVPGSAIFGPAILDGFDFGSVAPHQNYGIAFKSSNCLLVSGLDGASASTTVIAGVPARSDGMVWSADGSLAVLYSSNNSLEHGPLGSKRGWIQTITGLPGAPAAGAYVDISSLGGSLSAVAADAHGANIAIALSGAGGGVYLMSSSQPFAPILRLPKVTSLAFSPDGASLYALDTSTPQLSRVDLKTLVAENLPLDGLAQPLAIRPDQDSQGRQVIYVASGSDRLLRIIDLTTQQVVTDFPLTVAPSSIDTLGRDSFVIAARSQGTQPLWLFSVSPQPASYFVPAIYASAGGLQ